MTNRTSATKQLTPEQLTALTEYARTHGRTWKRQLLNDWFNGRCEGELQQIRNAYGPSWLKTFGR